MSESKPTKSKIDRQLWKLVPVHPLPFGPVPFAQWPSPRHEGSTCKATDDGWEIEWNGFLTELPKEQAIAIYKRAAKP